MPCKTPQNGIIKRTTKAIMPSARLPISEGSTRLYGRRAVINHNNTPKLHGRVIDLAGRQFGRWTVIEYAGKSRWQCRCECGTEEVVDSYGLRHGISISCGCYRTELATKRNVKDISGQRFGRLVAVEMLPKKGNKRQWKCICDCGNEVTVTSTNLGRCTQSCGCWRKEKRALQVGPNHPSWNEELTPEDRVKQRLVTGLSDWRKAIFERDDYTCQVCGARGKQLHAHHLNSWHWCKEERLLLSNGVTLCHTHHRQFHSEFGKDNNTAYQFAHFMEAKQ